MRTDCRIKFFRVIWFENRLSDQIPPCNLVWEQSVGSNSSVQFGLRTDCRIKFLRVIWLSTSTRKTNSTETLTYSGFGLILRSFHLPPRKDWSVFVAVLVGTVVILPLQQQWADGRRRLTFCTPATNAGCVARLSNHTLTTGKRSCSSAKLSVKERTKYVKCKSFSVNNETLHVAWL